MRRCNTSATAAVRLAQVVPLPLVLVRLPLVGVVDAVVGAHQQHRCPSIEWECVAYVESLLLRVHNQQSLLGFMAVPSSEKDVF